MTKKQFTDTICKTFDLKGITPNSFVYAVNCILIGIVMVKVPGRKAYKLFFTIFSLWEASLKECLNMPMFQQAIVNTKNMDIYLPESMTEDDSSFTIHQCSLQFRSSRRGTFLIQKLLIFYMTKPLQTQAYRETLY